MRARIWLSLILVAVAVCLVGCEKRGADVKEPQGKEARTMSIKVEAFGQTPDGQAVDLVTMTNPNGLRAKVTNYGGVLVSMEVPDRDGKLGDVVLGYDNLDDYVKQGAFFGATTGRYANRIGGAKFVLDGVEYKLAANNGPNHLHGGKKGFDKMVWKIEEAKSDDDEAVLKLSYLSKDGEEGYPGNLDCTVTYTLTKDDLLKFSYEATTDKPTVVNLTNHSYWNLAGQGNGDILGHELMIDADRYTPVDEGLIPTGELKSVKDSPMDFTKAMTIGSRIKEIDIGGYDHNYVLNSGTGKLALCARAYEPTRGRVMEIHTTEPGVQLYTGNFLDGSLVGKDGKAYKKHYAFCLETQHFPDSPNKPDFPSVVLRPDEKYQTETVHRFYTK
ncbi:MAG: galactose mutarotase [Planctomycetes bacterium]|nr:galactose mutarotase [Planctomycetota bacterium]